MNDTGEQRKRQLKTFMVWARYNNGAPQRWGPVDAYDTLDALRVAQNTIDESVSATETPAIEVCRADLIALRAKDPQNP